jgi:hypothetical protein
VRKASNAYMYGQKSYVLRREYNHAKMHFASARVPYDVERV